MRTVEVQKSTTGQRSVELLINYLLHYSLQWFRGVVSVIVHGSAARKEYSIYPDKECDVLVGNIGLIIVTDTPTIDRLLLPIFLNCTGNLENSNFRYMLDRPLMLVKPFEITLLPQSYLINKRIKPDIWSFEMVKANRVLYGDNLLSLFPTSFGPEAGLKMTISRMVGLSLSLPLILRLDYRERIKRIMINYESVKGILGALEALLTITNQYLPSYEERSGRANQIAETFADVLGDPREISALFEKASAYKLNPDGIENEPPLELWLQARHLLRGCLHIYKTKGFSLSSYIPKPKLKNRLMKFMSSVLHGKCQPAVLAMKHPMKTATEMLLACVSAFKEDNPLKKAERDQLIGACQHTNYLYTSGVWGELTDHIKLIKPKKN